MKTRRCGRSYIRMANIYGRIPRAVLNPSRTIKIHVFTDASSVAYAATIYIIQGREVFFVFAKSRIASIKGMTI